MADEETTNQREDNEQQAAALQSTVDWLKSQQGKPSVTASQLQKADEEYRIVKAKKEQELMRTAMSRKGVATVCRATEDMCIEAGERHEA